MKDQFFYQVWLVDIIKIPLTAELIKKSMLEFYQLEYHVNRNEIYTNRLLLICMSSLSVTRTSSSLKKFYQWIIVEFLPKLSMLIYLYISTVFGFLTGGSHFTRTECVSTNSIWTFWGGPGRRPSKLKHCLIHTPIIIVFIHNYYLFCALYLTISVFNSTENIKLKAQLTTLNKIICIRTVILIMPYIINPIQGI